MKKFFIVLFVLLSLRTYAQSDAVSFDGTQFNFGTIAEDGGSVSHTFHYTNNSTTPLVVLNVTTTCGCTTSEFSPKPLLKGEKGELTVNFNPDNFPGRNAKQVIVYTNQGDYTLRILGTVTPRERTLDELYPFGIGGGARLDMISSSMTKIEMGTEREITLGVANSNTSRTITIDVDRESLPKGVKVVTPAVTLRARNNSTIKLKIKGEEYGSYIHTIRFKVDGKAVAETLTIGGVVIFNSSELTESQYDEQPFAKFSTRYFNLAKVESGSKVEREVIITNDGNAPLIIYKIEDSSVLSAVTSQSVIEPGKSAKLEITYTPHLSGYDSQKVRLFLNDPRLPFAEITISAQVL